MLDLIKRVEGRERSLTIDVGTCTKTNSATKPLKLQEFFIANTAWFSIPPVLVYSRAHELESQKSDNV